MRGSHPAKVETPASRPTGPWGKSALDTKGRPRLKERVFRAPLFSQLTQGAWIFTFAALAPGLVAMLLMLWRVLAAEEDHDWVDVLFGLAILLIGPGLGALLQGLKPRTGGAGGATSTCGWIALGDGYIRLGMSFFRPKILFEQIVGTERGILKGGEWTAEVEAAQPAVAEGRQLASLKSIAGLREMRVRVRIVMRRTWEVRAFAYPVSMDPSGELTSALELAASRTRQKLGIPEGATDEEITKIYRDLEARFRAYAAERGDQKAVEDVWLTASMPPRGWTLPAPDRLPEPPQPLPPTRTPSLPR